MKKVRLLLGRTGSGKSYRIAQEIISLIDGGYGKTVYILVPDQYTMTSEKFYIDLLGERRFSQVRVMSVKRLCRHVLSAYGEYSANRLSQGGRMALCAKALKTASVHFKYYPADYFDMSFVKHLVKTFSSFTVAGISPVALLQAAEVEKNDRLGDIARIYMQYLLFTEEGLFDTDDDCQKLCECLDLHDFFASEYVYVDNFRTFHPQEREVIKAIALNNAFVTVAIPCENILPDDGLSLLSFISESARRFVGLLKKSGIEFTVETISGSPRFNTNPELKFLEENIFRDKAAAYMGQPEGIFAQRCLDIRDEVEAVAAEISRLVSEEGYDFRDINVTARNMDSYAAHLYPVFETYGIPFFHHKKTPLLHKSPVALIEALLSIALEGYTKNNTVALVKTGFLDISGEDEHLFEAYVKTWNVSGKKYLAPFTLKASGLSSEERESDKEKLDRINAVRERVVTLTRPFIEACIGKSVKDISVLVYEFITAVGFEEKLLTVAEEYKAMGEEDLYSQQLQVYGMFIDAMDELCAVMGEDRVPLSEYRELILSSIDAGDIGIIPTSVDEVMTGSIDKLPFMSPKCLFVLGMADGVFPSEISSDPIVTDEDSVMLEKHGLEYGMTAEQRLLYERFLSYVAFSAPTERLYISYSQSSGTRVSPYVEEVYSLFPDLKEDISPYLEGRGYESRIRSEKSAFEVMTRVGSPMLREFFESREGYSRILDSTSKGMDILSSKVSEELFGRRMRLSASRVDRYYKCKFSYFCQYGMGLSSNREAKIDALESGNFFHAALETLIPNLEGTKSDGEIFLAVQDFGKSYLVKLFGEETPPASFIGYFTQLLKKLYRLLLLFRKEWLHSEFKPVSFELKIDNGSAATPLEIPLEKGSVSLVGKVDRVDAFKKDGKTYIRVIDYKSGSKTFDLQNIYNGIDVQMLMYLHSITDKGVFGEKGEVLPAGIMYVNVNPVIVTVKRDGGLEEAEKELRNKRKRSGLLIDDSTIISAMDTTENGEFLPDVKKSENLATIEEFGQLFGHIEKLLAKMGNGLLSGRIEKNPVTLPGDRDGGTCKYCDFAPYCDREGCSGEYIYAKGKAIYEKIKEDGKGDTHA